MAPRLVTRRSSSTATGEFGIGPDRRLPDPAEGRAARSPASSPRAPAPASSPARRSTIEMAVYNGTTGELIEKTKYGADDTTPLSLVVAKDQLQEGLRKGLLCATEGSRIAVVVPPKDAFGEAGNASIERRPEGQPGLRHRRRQDLPDPRERRRADAAERLPVRRPRRERRPRHHHRVGRAAERPRRSPC